MLTIARYEKEHLGVETWAWPDYDWARSTPLGSRRLCRAGPLFGKDPPRIVDLGLPIALATAFNSRRRSTLPPLTAPCKDFHHTLRRSVYTASNSGRAHQDTSSKNVVR